MKSYMRITSGWDSKRNFKEVVLPKATDGDCKNVRRCRQYNVLLSNGYCIKCWDKGRGGD